MLNFTINKTVNLTEQQAVELAAPRSSIHVTKNQETSHQVGLCQTCNHGDAIKNWKSEFVYDLKTLKSRTLSRNPAFQNSSQHQLFLFFNLLVRIC